MADEESLPPIGSEERPYEMVIPMWMEKLAQRQGTTMQDMADEFFLPHVKVVIVEGADPWHGMKRYD